MAAKGTDARVAIARRWLQRLQPLTVVPVQVATQPPREFAYAAVLFDVYGTLLTSKAISGDEQASVIAEICVDVFPQLTPPALHHCHAIRNALYHQFQHALEIAQAQGKRAAAVDLRRVWGQVLRQELALNDADYAQVELFAFLYAVATHRVWPQPDLLPTIKALAAKKIPMGIISNAHFYTPIIISYFLECEISFNDVSIPWFAENLTFYSFQHGYAKPDDYLFVKAKQQLVTMGIDPAHTLYVGNDYRNDIDSANRNGLCSVLYAGDYSSYCRNHLTAEPNFIITKLSQLLSL